MKYTQIPIDTFKTLQMNAGMIVSNFNPANGEVSGLLGATTGGVTFEAAPTYEDFGEDIDNCPKNTMELKKLTEIAVTLSGTFLTISPAMAKILMGAADIDSNNAGHIVPRKDVLLTDFQDIWWVGDYSDKNTGATAGFCAVRIMNALNTGGLKLKSEDKGKGTFDFSFEGHFSMDAQDLVPYEIYIISDWEGTSSISLDTHRIVLTEDETFTFSPVVYPANSTITWTTGSSSVASVAAGVVTAEGTGNTIITASITDSDSVTYTDTCTVIVEAAEG